MGRRPFSHIDARGRRDAGGSDDTGETVLELEALGAYLNDHRAGATAALHLLERLAESDAEPVDGDPLERLRRDIAADLEALEDVMGRLDVPHDTVREAGGWMGEKLSRLRLSPVVTGSEHLSHLLELETVALGVHGKMSMWRALRHVADDESRVADVDFEALARRAEEQAEELESRRLDLARAAFRTG